MVRQNNQQNSFPNCRHSSLLIFLVRASSEQQDSRAISTYDKDNTKIERSMHSQSNLPCWPHKIRRSVKSNLFPTNFYSMQRSNTCTELPVFTNNDYIIPCPYLAQHTSKPDSPNFLSTKWRFSLTDLTASQHLLNLYLICSNLIPLTEHDFQENHQKLVFEISARKSPKLLWNCTCRTTFSRSDWLKVDPWKCGGASKQNWHECEHLMNTSRKTTRKGA